MESKDRKPFRITIETLDDLYISEGGATKVRVIECEGYFLNCCNIKTSEDGSEYVKADGCTVSQGMLNAGTIAEGIHNVDNNLSEKVEKALNTLNGPDGEFMSMLKKIIERSDEDGEREAD